MSYTSLKGEGNVRRVVSRGKRRIGDGLALYYSLSGLDTNRYAVGARLKVGKATVRNKVRRWARALLRKWENEIDPGYDIVVIAWTPETAESYSGFAERLASALLKAELADGELKAY